jgi:hypothetical protein
MGNAQLHQSLLAQQTKYIDVTLQNIQFLDGQFQATQVF